ncbi:MAG TPA: peroxidase [Polyangiaceae bacterium]|jgi:alkylhydroperoxidase family enzyme
MKPVKLKPMHLPDVEASEGGGSRAEAIARLRAEGLPIPQLWHNFAFKPDRTEHLQAFTHGVMRGPSPLSAGERELIAAFTSKRNQCPY